VLSWLANAWRVPELRRRVLFTAAVLSVYRLGTWIPAPGVNAADDPRTLQRRRLRPTQPLQRRGARALLDLRARDHAVRHGLDRAAAHGRRDPELERLQKEGESGYAKINQYTRYLTIVLAALQAAGYAYLFHRSGGLKLDAGRFVLIVITLTAGTCAA
jgi:preprotein translocase subunit SecY